MGFIRNFPRSVSAAQLPLCGMFYRPARTLLASLRDMAAMDGTSAARCKAGIQLLDYVSAEVCQKRHIGDNG
jgi:hypothetical protein